MKVLASFVNKSDAVKVQKQLLTRKIVSQVIDHTEDQVYTIYSDDFDENPETVESVMEVAASNGSISCPECQSSMVQFPAGPGEKFILPQIVEALTSRITGNAHEFQCYKCNLQWGPDEAAE